MRYLVRFRKSIMFGIKACLVLAMTFTFIEVWQTAYEETLFSRNGNYVVILLYLVSILLATLLTAMLIKSQYIVNDRYLVMQFGIIRQKYEIKKVCSVHHFRGAHKLAVYFDEFKSKYIMIVVNERWFDDFISALIARSSRIEVTVSSPEEEREFKKKK